MEWNQLEFEKERAKLLNHINTAFGAMQPPTSYRHARSQAEFYKWYADKKYEGLSSAIYNLEADEAVYLIQFALRAYVIHYGEDVIADSNLNLFLFAVDGLNEDLEMIRNRYLHLYNRFDRAQTSCICCFLMFLVKHEMDDGYVSDKMLNFWCQNDLDKKIFNHPLK